MLALHADADMTPATLGPHPTSSTVASSRLLSGSSLPLSAKKTRWRNSAHLHTHKSTVIKKEQLLMYHFVIVVAAAVATAIVAVAIEHGYIVVAAATETLLLLYHYYTWCDCYYCFLFLFLLLFLLLCSVTAGRECLVVQPSPLPDGPPAPRAKVCSGVVLIQTVVQEPKLRRGRGMRRLHGVRRRRRRRRRHSCHASFPPTHILISTYTPLLAFWGDAHKLFTFLSAPSSAAAIQIRHTTLPFPLFAFRYLRKVIFIFFFGFPPSMGIRLQCGVLARRTST